VLNKLASLQRLVFVPDECAKIQPMKKLVFLVTLFAMLTSACGTPEPVATSSVTDSPSPLPTETPVLPATLIQPTLTATPILVEGVLTIKVNVRSGPGTGYDSLGQLETGVVV